MIATGHNIEERRSVLKASANAAIDRQSAGLIRFADDVFAHPETGYREERSATCVADALRKLGLNVDEGLAITGHAYADATTGAAHECGHNAQSTAQFAGQVVFLAVPAEEYVDFAWRSERARRGIIEFLGGKLELERLGVFDEIDRAMMVHASGTAGDEPLSIRWAYKGFIAKRVRFRGQAAHAGVAPFRGVNA